jgi:hypothetical protein
MTMVEGVMRRQWGGYLAGAAKRLLEGDGKGCQAGEVMMDGARQL